MTRYYKLDSQKSKDPERQAYLDTLPTESELKAEQAARREHYKKWKKLGLFD